MSPTRWSERSVTDREAPLGEDTTRVLDRILAACGLLTRADLTFATADDVPQAGVRCALPALLAEGLLRPTRLFYPLPPGYYPREAIFLYLALLALGRCTSLEQTRDQAPGEWGRLLGLDRLPEFKTLRVKITLLCATAGQAGQGQTRLAREWIAAATDLADLAGQGRFYVDGHLRVYHGGRTSLPRRYVARERLCLRGTTDYCVNAGLLAALRKHVIPPLLASLPAAAANGTATTLLAKHLRPRGTALPPWGSTASATRRNRWPPATSSAPRSAPTTSSPARRGPGPSFPRPRGAATPVSSSRADGRPMDAGKLSPLYAEKLWPGPDDRARPDAAS